MCRLCAAAAHRTRDTTRRQATMCPHCTLQLCEAHAAEHMENISGIWDPTRRRRNRRLALVP